MRIVAGRLRGLKLAEIGQGDAAAHLRPTTDRVREAIFNLLVNGSHSASHGNPVTDARVLDLFAGSGALGLEALSRGAAQVDFVDDGAVARALIRANVDRARAQAVTAIRRGDATRLGIHRGPPYTLVFLDPPYGKGLGEAAIAAALAGGWIAPGALVVWEESRAPLLPAPLVRLDQRSYGDTVVTLARMAGPVPAGAAPADATPSTSGPSTSGPPTSGRAGTTPPAARPADPTAAAGRRAHPPRTQDPAARPPAGPGLPAPPRRR